MEGRGLSRGTSIFFWHEVRVGGGEKISVRKIRIYDRPLHPLAAVGWAPTLPSFFQLRPPSFFPNFPPLMASRLQKLQVNFDSIIFFFGVAAAASWPASHKLGRYSAINFLYSPRQKGLMSWRGEGVGLKTHTGASGRVGTGRSGAVGGHFDFVQNLPNIKKKPQFGI